MKWSETQSPWLAGRFDRYPELGRDLDVDVVIVGAGITGLATAWLLKQAGKTVCVLERDRLGHGDTGVTTAHLTAVTDLRRVTLRRRFGDDAARAVWAAGMTAIATIEDMVSHLSDCEFQRVPGYLYVRTRNRHDRRIIEKEVKAAARLGLDAEWVAAAPVVRRAAIRFADQALVNPAKLLRALARQIPGRGSHLYEQSEVTVFTRRPRGVKANGFNVRCRHIVVATHVPLTGNTDATQAALFQSKLIPTSTYAIEAKLPRRAAAAASFWDTGDPYRYLRIEDRGGDLRAILGGEDHKTGQAARLLPRFARLTSALQRLFPKAAVHRQWSGQVIETVDGLPYIGESAPGQFIATGYSGNGMTWGVVAGLMARDWVMGEQNPWSELLGIHRRTWRSGWRYVKENLDYPFYLMRDRLRAPRAKTPASLRAGEAAVLRVEGQPVACQRDEKGKLHTVSAVCTHLGCLVRWNAAERTWDCPCHGSRFKVDGEVMAGPAEKALEQVSVPP